MQPSWYDYDNHHLAKLTISECHHSACTGTPRTDCLLHRSPSPPSRRVRAGPTHLALCPWDVANEPVTQYSDTCTLAVYRPATAAAKPSQSLPFLSTSLSLASTPPTHYYYTLLPHMTELDRRMPPISCVHRPPTECLTTKLDCRPPNLILCSLQSMQSFPVPLSPVLSLHNVSYTKRRLYREASVCTWVVVT